MVRTSMTASPALALIKRKIMPPVKDNTNDIRKESPEMKGFSVCNTVLSLTSLLHVKEGFNKYFNLKQEQREEIILTFGLHTVIEKTPLPCLALPVNRENEVVAVYANGRLVCLSKKDRINHAQRHPFTIKKKGWRKLKVVRGG